MLLLFLMRRWANYLSMCFLLSIAQGWSQPCLAQGQFLRELLQSKSFAIVLSSNKIFLADISGLPARNTYTLPFNPNSPNFFNNSQILPIPLETFCF